MGGYEQEAAKGLCRRLFYLVRCCWPRGIFETPMSDYAERKLISVVVLPVDRLCRNQDRLFTDLSVITIYFVISGPGVVDAYFTSA